MNRASILSGRLCALYVSLTLAVCLQTGAGEARGQSAKAQTAQAPALESIRLDPLFPDLSAMPSFDKLKWRHFKGKLGTNQVHKEDRAVSSGMYYIGYIEMFSHLEQAKKSVENQKRELQKLAPDKHAARLQKLRNELIEAEKQIEQYEHYPNRQQRYIDKAAELRKKIEYLEKSYSDDYAEAEKQLKDYEESLAKTEKETPDALAMRDLNMSAILQVISGIQYLEDPDGWMKAIGAYDPLFRKANSAGVGEYSILSPKQHFYDVRFKRGKYIVSIMVTRGPGSGKFDVGIHEAGKAIAEVFDRKLMGDVPGISVEKGERTKTPYAGVAADGQTALELTVFLPDVSNLRVEAPPLGSLFRVLDDAEKPLEDGAVPLSHDGRAKIFYRPPPYLQEEKLTEHIPLGQAPSPDGERIWYAPVPLVFTWLDKDGRDVKKEILLRATRPPVMLVHGFTGAKSTWENLDRDLARHKWHTHRDEYYYGDKGISDQAVLLRSFMGQTELLYEKNGIKAKKVDIVAHSMGGLISRHYISVSGTYDDNVRKLIMVATPNHGSTWWDEQIGKVASIAGGISHWKENKDLYWDSEFMKQLNAGEETGRHLAPGVQYAVLYGRRNGYWIPTVDVVTGWMMADDGVVSVESALLQGVVNYCFNGSIHSGAVALAYPRDISITEDRSVWARVKASLLEDLPRTDFYHPKVLVTDVLGQVSRRAGVTRFLLPRWQQVQAGENVEKYVLISGPDSGFEADLMTGDEVWGKVTVHENSRVLFASVSNHLARIFIYSGKVSFRFAKGQASFCQVAVGDEKEKILELRPLMNIYHLDTVFTVARHGDTAEVVSTEGELGVEYVDPGGRVTRKSVSGGESLSVDLEPARQALTSRTEEEQAFPPADIRETETTEEKAAADEIIPRREPAAGEPEATVNPRGHVVLEQAVFLADSVIVSVVYKSLPPGSPLAVEVGGADGSTLRSASTVVGGSGTWDFWIAAPLMGWPETRRLVRVRLGETVVLEETVDKERKKR